MQGPKFTWSLSTLDDTDPVEVKLLSPAKEVSHNPQALAEVPAEVAEVVCRALQMDVLEAHDTLRAQLETRLKRFERDRANKQLYSDLCKQVLVVVKILSCLQCTGCMQLPWLPCITPKGIHIPMSAMCCYYTLFQQGIQSKQMSVHILAYLLMMLLICIICDIPC